MPVSVSISASARLATLSRDSACVLTKRGLRLISELPDASRGVLATDVSAIDSATVFAMGWQIAGTTHADSFWVVNFYLRRPYDADVWFPRVPVMVRRIHKAF